MSDNVENLYPDQYKKIKDLGYDTVEIRNLQANLDLDYHLHPFTACMYIISGEVKIEDLNKKILGLEALLADADLYRKDRSGFESATRDLAKRRSALRKSENRWLELVGKSEQLRGRSLK